MDKKVVTDKVIMSIFKLCMAVVFTFQAYLSVHKCLQKKVIEDISYVEAPLGIIPAITVCPIPGYNSSINTYLEMLDLDTECNGERNLTHCLESLMLKREDFVAAVLRAPNITITEQSFRPVSLNLACGMCFTFKSNMPSEGSIFISDTIALKPELPPAVLYITVHDETPIMPLNGLIGGGYSRNFVPFTPRRYSFLQISLSVVQREDLSTANGPCHEADDYYVTQCIEAFVANHIGCASPWDVFPRREEVRVCSSKEDFLSLQAIHQKLNAISATSFRDLTNCIPRCNRNDVDLTFQHMDNKGVAFNYSGVSEDQPLIIVGIHTTTKKLVKQTLLYDLNNLVGELGGSLGLFLGASIVSLFQYALILVKRLSKIL